MSGILLRAASEAGLQWMTAPSELVSFPMRGGEQKGRAREREGEGGARKSWIKGARGGWRLGEGREKGGAALSLGC